MEIIQINNCLINVENITWVHKKKNKVTIAFNDRFSLLDFKNDEAEAFWDWFQKRAKKI